MEIYSVARRMSALTLLVATLLLVGMPRPTMAAGQKDVAVTRHRALTINGRPLSEFVALPAPLQTLPENRRRVSADRLLGGAPVTDSFEALNAILDPGYEVVVWDEAGRKRLGQVLSISGEEVVVKGKRRWFGNIRSLEELVFGADSITRVDIVDSTWNGALSGAAVTLGVVAVMTEIDCPRSCDDEFGRSGRWAAFSALFLPAGILAGAAFDLSVNEPVFEQPSDSLSVTVAPLIGRDQKGLAVRVSF